MSDQLIWKTVSTDREGRAIAERAEVPGGWLFAVYEEPGAFKFAGVCFVLKPPEGSDAPIHVCDHGYNANSCALCIWPRDKLI